MIKCSNYIIHHIAKHIAPVQVNILCAIHFQFLKLSGFYISSKSGIPLPSGKASAKTRIQSTSHQITTT